MQHDVTTDRDDRYWLRAVVVVCCTLMLSCVCALAQIAVDVSGGDPISGGLRGQNLYRNLSSSGFDALSSLGAGTSFRGVAGGLDADTYDWRDIDSGSGWGDRNGRYSTLEFLRACRDQNAKPVITINVWGGGYRQGDGTWYCQYNNPEQLAADWVRYCNIIVQNYDSANPPTSGEDLRVYDSITGWEGRDILPAPGEAKPPMVMYWEIGNEPELDEIAGLVENHYLSPADYATRYDGIATAMLAVDPGINVGPCVIYPAGTGGNYLTALHNAGIQMDFVGYHPYRNLKHHWIFESELSYGLKTYKAEFVAESDAARSIVGQDVELIAGEFNPMSWDASPDQYNSMANALGLVEAIFTFAEEDMTAAHYWEQAQGKANVVKIYQALNDWMGDVHLLSTSVHCGFGYPGSDQCLRVYVTKDSVTDTVYVWGLNFEYDLHYSVRLNLQNWSSPAVGEATLHTFNSTTGDTQLMSYTDLDWQHESVSVPDIDNVYFEVEDASLFVLELRPAVCGDWGYQTGDINHDCAVDGEDLLLLQAQWGVCYDPEDIGSDPNCSAIW